MESVLSRRIRFSCGLALRLQLARYLIQRLCLEHPRGEFLFELLVVRLRGELLFLQVLSGPELMSSLLPTSERVRRAVSVALLFVLTLVRFQAIKSLEYSLL